jgi:hypothetical protein
MSYMLTPNHKQILQRQIAAGRKDLEELLLEGLNSGKSKPMMAARKKRICQQALADSLQTARQKSSRST